MRIRLVTSMLLVASAAAAQGMFDATSTDTSAFNALRWREIGPFRGGRSVAAAGSAARANEFWMGTTGGGVYKSSDGGYSWAASGEKYFGGTIGAVQVSESNPDIVYVGTGEWTMRGNVSAGNGVWKTTDAGKTWTLVGLEKTGQISRIRIHPTNPDIVYVAAEGDAYGPNPDRGVFKSTDGGKSWRKVLFRNDSTGAADLSMDASDPNTLYAALWQGGRRPWALISGGGDGSGLFKTTDGGEHWTEITANSGLPPRPIGKIGVSVSPANPKRVYAIVEQADVGGAYRSDDGGATWKYVSGEHKLRERAWYYSMIVADPKNPDVAYAPEVSLYKTTDGGVTWRWVQEPHGDNHDIWIAPNDPMRIIQTSDGGASVSYNGGATWSLQDYATAQFYHVGVTNHFPYRVCGAQQDNSALCGPSRFEGGIPWEQWYDPGGGEAGWVVSPPDRPDITYANDNSGLLTWKDHKTGFLRVISVWPNDPDGHPASESKFRFQWTSPILVSPHDPNVLFAAGNVLFMTTNQGQSWTRLSGDLTRNDPKTTGISGGPITHDQTTAEYYATIFAIAQSPIDKNVLWTGSDDGLIYVTRDFGKTWTKVTPPNFGDFTRVSIIEAGHYAAGTAYVAANRYQLQDVAPYLYKTTDYGKTWTKIVTGMPANEFTRSIREDPERKGLLFSSTERSVYVSFDDGDHWRSLKRNLPFVPVHDLIIKDNDLIAATHGRSFWILDDISPLRQMTPDAMQKPFAIFKPSNAYRINWGQVDDHQPSSQPMGMNPPSGAILYYWLSSANQAVTIDILDAKGKLIRSFKSGMDSLSAADSARADGLKAARADSLRKAGATVDTAALTSWVEGLQEHDVNPVYPQRVPPDPRAPNKAGLNRFAWNMQYPPARMFVGGMGISSDGPMALAGTYWARISVNGKSDSVRFTLVNDPRGTADAAALRAQFDFQMKVRDTVSAGVTALLTVRNVRQQLDDAIAKLGAADAAKVKQASDPFRAHLNSIEKVLYETRLRSDEDNLVYEPGLLERTSNLGAMASSMPARPTNQMVEVFSDFAPHIGQEITDLNNSLKTDLPKVNAALKAAGAPEIKVSSVDVLKAVSKY